MNSLSFSDIKGPYYFSFLPSELINVIGTYLDYNECLIISKNLEISLDYNYLLSNNYPIFYMIIKELKEKDVKYRNYPYEKGYSLCNLIDRYYEFYEDYEAIKIFHSNNYDKFIGRGMFNIEIREFNDIIESYKIMHQENDLYKYKEYFPDIINGDDSFESACFEYKYSTGIDQIIENYNNTEKQYQLSFLIF